MGDITAPVPKRLLNGARVLGSLWNKKVRCPALWEPCECEGSDRTVFCEAKKQWLALALEKLDPPRATIAPGSTCSIINLMSNEELDASAITMKIDLPGVGVVKVGSKGEVSFTALEKVGPDALKSVVAILRKFPGAKVIT